MTPCLLCQNNELTFLRTPLGTRRGARVYVCAKCGLIQSRYGEQGTVEARGDGVARPSSLADYGNLRTGKRERTQAALDALSSFSEQSPRLILDVGASRGDFCLSLIGRYQACVVEGVEPDWNVVGWVFDQDLVDRLILNIRRIESLPIQPCSYQWMNVLHTLEHLSDPLEQMTRLTTALTHDGLMYVEVPDIGALTERNDLVEELFIDKHVVHFTSRTLRAMLTSAGLEVKVLDSDGENLWAVCAPSANFPEPVPFSPEEVERAVTSVRFYDTMLQMNLALMKRSMPALNERLSRRRTVIWGAGRILDALARAGLDSTLLEAVIDTRSPLDEFRGVPVLRPASLDGIKPECVLVCSRSSTGEIESEAARLVPGAEIIKWKQLVEVRERKT